MKTENLKGTGHLPAEKRAALRKARAEGRKLAEEKKAPPPADPTHSRGKK